MEERVAMLREYESGAYGVTELCGRYGVSRETFYVWKRRRDAGGERWFEAGSRAPLSCPHAVSVEVAAAVIAMRRRFPAFGPKKVRARLMLDRPDLVWPAASTMGDILAKAGLVETADRRRRPLSRGSLACRVSAPNEEWAMDFKGWFRTRDGARIDPLTVSDTASRFLVEARIVGATQAGVKGALTRVFQDKGLPMAMRCDNGPPFGSTGAGGLSRLAVWLLKLGVEPRYIPPASPQDNGRLERLHRTMAEETTSPPAADASEQQARFDRFRARYNEERPHEALGQTTPASHWTPSPRAMPERLDEPWYDASHQVRRVRPDGVIKWRGEAIFIGEAFGGEPIGLAELETGGFIVRFLHRDLGVIATDGRFKPFAPPRNTVRTWPETDRVEG